MVSAHRPGPEQPGDSRGRLSGEAAGLLAIGIDRPVRQHEGAGFASEDLRLNAPKQQFGGLLGVGNLAHPAEVIPGDLKRAFNKNWKWFTHTTETPRQPHRSYVGACRPGDLNHSLM